MALRLGLFKKLETRNLALLWYKPSHLPKDELYNKYIEIVKKQQQPKYVFYNAVIMTSKLRA